MVDTSILDKYICPLERFDIDIINRNILDFGLDKVLENQFKYVDCTRTVNGRRLSQTIGFPYMNEISRTIYLIQNFFQDTMDEKLQKLLDIHNKNIEYEKENPPIWYGGKENKKKFDKFVKDKKSKSSKDGKLTVSAAERKLALKIGKINALKFTLKPANNNESGNTL